MSSETFVKPGSGGTSFLGNAVPRREDLSLLQGKGGYVANIPMEGAVYAHFVRSSISHGEIISVETGEALKPVTGGNLDDPAVAHHHTVVFEAGASSVENGAALIKGFSRHHVSSPGRSGPFFVLLSSVRYVSRKAGRPKPR